MSDDAAEANAKNPRFTHWAASLIFSIITMTSAVIIVSAPLECDRGVIPQSSIGYASWIADVLLFIFCVHIAIFNCLILKF